MRWGTQHLLRVEETRNLKDPQGPKQCALLVSVAWKQGGTLGIEHGKVRVCSRGKKLKNSNKFWMLLNFEDCDHKSGTENLEFYLRAPIFSHVLFLRKKSISTILNALFKFLAGNGCFLVSSVCGWIITVVSADEIWGGGGSSRYNLPGPESTECAPTKFIIIIIIYLSR
jgi:hypothetical protein